MVTMHDGHMSRIFGLSHDKGMTPDRWTNILASPIFAALLDERADLSNPEMVLALLGLPVKKSRSTRHKVLAGLLELDGDPANFAAVERFVAREKLVVDINGELPISYLGDNLKANFLDLVEEGVKPMTLKQRKLLKASVDRPIISALGGEKKAEVAMAHAFEFLKTADRNRWYIFYVRDAKGTLWAVCARWDDDGWRVGASPVTYPVEWIDGYRVVSR